MLLLSGISLLGGIIKVMNKGFFSVFLSTHLNKNKRGFTYGFTMIELMVTMSVMVVLLGTVLANYPSSSVRINLALINHETSLAIREAQLRGSAVDSKDLSVGGYGVFFTRSASQGYVYFSDIATNPGPNGLSIGDAEYSTLFGADETIATTTYPQKFLINKICIGKGHPFDGTNGGSCNDDASSSMPAISTLTISFTRPKPRPIITINQDDIPNKLTNQAGACIESISSKGGPGTTRSVQVYLSGRIVTSDRGCQ